MIFSYNWIKEYISGKPPNAKKLAEILTFSVFEVQEVKKSGKDWQMDIDVLANRSDCFSHIGIAREAAAVTGLKLKLALEKIKKDSSIKDSLDIRVENRKDCLRYSAGIVKGVKIGVSPKWMQERLKVCGLDSINNVVDIMNYVMLETGQPLHAFDLDKIDKIIVRRTKKRENMVGLDNKEYELDKDTLVIADSKKLLAIAGIKGARSAEIDKNTKDIVIESANFDQKLIRQASRKINLRTDASFRFEHRIDLNLTVPALERAIVLIQKIAGGKTGTTFFDIYPQKRPAKTIILNPNHIKRVLGIPVAKTILAKLGFRVQGNKVLVPTFRLDINIPEDLIEEIGRVHGYNKIPGIFPSASLVPPKKNLNFIWQNKAKDILQQAGFSEIYNYSFADKGEVKVLNPICPERGYLRDSLIFGLLNNVKENLKHLLKSRDIRIFELGKVFSKKSEKNMLTLALAGDNPFYQLKGAADCLMQGLGISDAWYNHRQIDSIWGVSAEVKIGSQTVGILGEVSSKILKDLKINKKVGICDLDFNKLSLAVSKEKEYRPISRFPAAIRDLAVLVPRDVLVEQVIQVISRTGGMLVADVDLFDVYQGKELPEDKKNLAFRIIYQSKDKTLSSEEINKLHNKIIEVLEKNLQWEVRK